MKILEISQIIYLLRPYYVNLGSRVVKSPKVYFTDVGLLTDLLGVRDKRTLFHGPQAGAIFENFVIQEVLKLYFHGGRTPPIFYYRTNNGLEVDLIVEERAGVIRPCEIKLTNTPQTETARSIRRLRDLNRGKKVIVTNGSVVCRIDGKQPLERMTAAYGVAEFLKSLIKT